MVPVALLWVSPPRRREGVAVTRPDLGQYGEALGPPAAPLKPTAMRLPV